MTEKKAELEKKLQAMRQVYLSALDDSIALFAQFASSCERGDSDPEHRVLARSQAHKLVGSGATYGFETISKTARVLEEALMASELPPPDALAVLSHRLVEACRSAQVDKISKRAELDQDDRALALASKPVLLTVDDDEQITAMIGALFEDSAVVLSAESAEKALEIVYQKKPHLILLDEKMNGMSGLAFLEILNAKEQSHKAGVVMLTADENYEVVFEAYKLGVIDYIRKPFDPQQLKERVTALLGRLRHNILIVDDDPAIRDILGGKFKSLGYGVSFAESAQQALDYACALKPSLIVMDRMLPGGDGLAVFVQLQKNPETKTIPVIFLTAKKREDEVLDVLNQGAHDCIVKPFKVEEAVFRCIRTIEAGGKGR